MVRRMGGWLGIAAVLALAALPAGPADASLPPAWARRPIRPAGAPPLPPARALPGDPPSLAVPAGPPATDLPDTIDVKLPDGSVVTLDLEEYLKGVVPKEIGAYFPVEAMKAQAVAARSYALWYVWANGSICTTTKCQAWSAQHYPATDAAVEATRGQVLAFGGEIVPAFYSASCGGHTIGAEVAWGGDPLPWLTPADCIESKVDACAPACTPDHAADETCWGIYGHRVGLCQRGAQAMGRCGDSYVAILGHYLGGTTLIGPGVPVPDDPAAPDVPVPADLPADGGDASPGGADDGAPPADEGPGLGDGRVGDIAALELWRPPDEGVADPDDEAWGCAARAPGSAASPVAITALFLLAVAARRRAQCISRRFPTVGDR